jgi:molecular chaperone DnaK (HSP70)
VLGQATDPIYLPDIVVVEFGAGKLDLSLVHKDGPNMTVLRADGNPSFGGMDLDSTLVDVIAKEIPPDKRVSR